MPNAFQNNAFQDDAFQSPNVAVTGAGAIAFRGPALVGTGSVASTAITGTGSVRFHGPSLGPLVTDFASGGGKAIFRDSLRLPGLPWKPKEFDLPNEPLPEQPPLAEPVFVDLRPDNTAAFIALFEAGALTEHEFVALLAA